MTTPPEAGDTVAAFDPHKPIVVILADARGTEAPDLLATYAILADSDAADVRIVSATAEPIRLTAGVAWVLPQLTLDELARSSSHGPDVVIVPALSVVDDQARHSWLRKQNQRGAHIMSICDGAKVLAAAGLLEGRRATVHWYSRAKLAREYPNVSWRQDLRWVTDGQITTTAGISAFVPASLALLRDVCGDAVMHKTAHRFGLPLPDQRHQGSAFRLTVRDRAVAVGNRLAFWRHEKVAVPMSACIDEFAFATELDAWSRTYRSIAWAAGPLRVVLRHGLTLCRAHSLPKKLDREICIPRSNIMETAFDQIRQAYGAATASFVALQFEHPYRAVVATPLSD